MKKLVGIVKKLNLIWKLTILYMIVISIPLTFFAYYFYNQSYRQVIENYNSIYRIQLYQEEATIRKELSKAEFLSQSICHDNALRKYIEFYANGSEYDLLLFTTISPYLSNISLLNSDIYSFTIYSSNNNLPRYQNIIFNDTVIQGETWFNRLKKSHSESIIWDFPHYANVRNLNGFKTGVSKQNIISLHSKIISNYTQKELGFLEINIKTNDLLSYNGKNTNNQYQLMLLDQSTNKAYDFFNNTYTLNSVKELSENVIQGYDTITVDNIEYIALGKDIKELDSRLILLYPYKYIWDALSGKVYIVIMLAFMVLVSISLIGYLVTNIILKRLKMLVDAMKIVQEGKFDVKLEIDSSDEIGQIIKAFNMMVCKINNLITTVYIKELSEKKTMLSYLQAQLNPHFLFNSLESIRMLSEAGKNEDASYAIYCLSKLMRYHFTIKGIISLNEELSIVKTYINLLNIRFKKRIHLQIDIKEEYYNIAIPSLILEPLVENSIKHGFKNSNKLCLIRIKIKQSDEKTYKITVTDNGNGIPKDKCKHINDMLILDTSCSTETDSNNHIGLININTRIQLNYGENYRLKLYSYLGKGTVSQITIPYTPI